MRNWIETAIHSQQWDHRVSAEYVFARRTLLVTRWDLALHESYEIRSCDMEDMLPADIVEQAPSWARLALRKILNARPDTEFNRCIGQSMGWGIGRCTLADDHDGSHKSEGGFQWPAAPPVELDTLDLEPLRAWAEDVFKWLRLGILSLSQGMTGPGNDFAPYHLARPNDDRAMAARVRHAEIRRRLELREQPRRRVGVVVDNGWDSDE